MKENVVAFPFFSGFDFLFLLYVLENGKTSKQIKYSSAPSEPCCPSWSSLPQRLSPQSYTIFLLTFFSVFPSLFSLCIS